MTNDKGKKSCHGKGIGGMAGNETVKASPIAVDDMDRRLQRGVMGWAQTLHEVLDET